MIFFSKDIVFEEVVKSTSTYVAQQELERALSEERNEHFEHAQVEFSQKRFKSVGGRQNCFKVFLKIIKQV